LLEKYSLKQKQRKIKSQRVHYTNDLEDQRVCNIAAPLHTPFKWAFIHIVEFGTVRGHCKLTSVPSPVIYLFSFLVYNLYCCNSRGNGWRVRFYGIRTKVNTTPYHPFHHRCSRHPRYRVRPDFGGPYIIDVRKQFSGPMVLKRDEGRKRETETETDSQTATERERKRVKFKDNK